MESMTWRTPITLDSTAFHRGYLLFVRKQCFHTPWPIGIGIAAYLDKLKSKANSALFLSFSQHR